MRDVWKHYCTKRREWWSTWLYNCSHCGEAAPKLPQVPGIHYPSVVAGLPESELEVAARQRRLHARTLVGDI